MRHLWPMAAVALMLCTLAAAHAAPSFLGDTGLILTPNARTADRHTALPHWHSMTGTVGEYKGNSSSNWDAAGVLVGLTDRLELYLGYFSFDDRPFARVSSRQNGFSHFEGENSFVAHIKAQALREPDDCFDLAIGVRNLGLDDGYGKDPTAYVVGTKTVSGSEEDGKYVRVSLGLQMANEDDFFNEEYWPGSDGDFDENSIFGSAEWRLNRHVAVMAEVQEVGSSVVNYGARLNPCESIAVDAFFIDDKADDDRNLGFGVSGLIPFDADNVFADEDRSESHSSTAPSHFGDTGLILIPNALTAPRHTATPTYHLISGNIGDDDGNDIGDWQNLGVLVGTTDRLEVYAGQLSFEDDPFSSGDKYEVEEFVVHAKAQALREPDNHLNVAVGVRNVGLDTVGERSDNEPTAYIVATKTLCSSEDAESFFRATVGLFLANEDGLFSEDYFPEDKHEGDYEDSSLFAGAEWRPCRWVTFMGEIIEVGDDENAFNFGARLHPIENLVVDGYFVDDVERRNHEFGFGASYQIDF